MAAPTFFDCGTCGADFHGLCGPIETVRQTHGQAGSNCNSGAFDLDAKAQAKSNARATANSYAATFANSHAATAANSHAATFAYRYASSGAYGHAGSGANSYADSGAYGYASSGAGGHNECVANSFGGARPSFLQRAG